MDKPTHSKKTGIIPQEYDSITLFIPIPKSRTKDRHWQKYYYTYEFMQSWETWKRMAIRLHSPQGNPT